MARRPPEKRAIDNARYKQRRASEGLVVVNVMVPMVRLTELDALLVDGGPRRARRSSTTGRSPTRS